MPVSAADHDYESRRLLNCKTGDFLLGCDLNANRSVDVVLGTQLEELIESPESRYSVVCS
jgi:hypothetical protein